MTATCTKLMIIRHAEKPDKLAGISGVTEAGETDRDDLTVRGWQRAGALVHFFNPATPVGPTPGLAVPGAIFATSPNGDSPSKRPLHTVSPLAADLGLRVRTDFTVHQENDLIAAALRAAKTVLVCWHHERIAKLAAPLGITIAPWPDDVFDRVLLFDAAGAGWSTGTLRQHLLPGDA
ncbi:MULTISPECIES: hypothetical protein [Methylobacterium]|uniref:hypothetical protein n=1 Tax=Methylobacterium TaxID=407 RepID=UPI0013EDBD7F|nr:hypothetical protein [Methylobacterium sp. DB0501]NGM32587.1 hypothetical protein [Methylobacterium sp. DB0501]